MSQNPPPSDAATAQAVFDSTTGILRARLEEERTAAGQGVDHNKYIVCSAIGVSCTMLAPLHNAHTFAAGPVSHRVMHDTA
jgi:hypothetical protein